MANETKVTKKDQVFEMLQAGTFTKQQMADALDCKVGSISSNFTYLRWAGNFIKTDADGVCSLITEEEYEALEAEKAANRKEKTPATTKTPKEQAEAAEKSIKRMSTTLENWEQKQDAFLVEFEDKELNIDDQDKLDEAAANITLLKIKIKRANARLAALADQLSDEDETEAEDEADVDTEPEEELM
jgi:hypothetical protein